MDSQSNRKISDSRMDEIVRRARNAATKGYGGGDGTAYYEVFSDDIYKSTLAALIANEADGAETKEQ